MTVVVLVCYVLGILMIFSVGYSDLRTRYIEREWRYFVIVLCGLLTRSDLIVSALIWFLQMTLIILSVLIVSVIRRRNDSSNQGGILSVIGGADIKFLGAVSFFIDPFSMVISIFLSIFVSIPFFCNPTLGLRADAFDNAEKGKIPFCFTLACGIILFIIVKLFLIFAYLIQSKSLIS